MTEPFRTIVADPPWPFRDKLPGNGRGAVKHYDLMALQEIIDYDLAMFNLSVAGDSRLFLWRVASMQEEALAVMRAWGFEPKAEMVWVKYTNRIPRRLRLGMGRQVRNAHESCIIGIRGKPERLDLSVPSVVFAPRSQHSAKPDKFYEYVERLSPGPYLELFARKQRPGWTVLGDEVPQKQPLTF